MRLIDAENIERTQLDLCDLGYDICFEVILLEDIEAAPTIEAEPVRHGYWVKYPHGSGIYCSECHKRRRYKDIHDGYCPKCGAKMRGEADE